MAGLKEWAIVCKALEEGRQVVLLRKGGIREYKEGFTLKHPDFFLFPTFEHQDKNSLQQDYVIRFEDINSEVKFQSISNNNEKPNDYTIISLYARAELVKDIADKSILKKVEKYHIWNEHYIDIRMNYNPSKPLSLVLLRVYKLANPIRVFNERAWAGCKSWIPINIDLPSTANFEKNFSPVLDNEKFNQIQKEIMEVMS